MKRSLQESACALSVLCVLTLLGLALFTANSIATPVWVPRAVLVPPSTADGVARLVVGLTDGTTRTASTYLLPPVQRQRYIQYLQLVGNGFVLLPLVAPSQSTLCDIDRLWFSTDPVKIARDC